MFPAAFSTPSVVHHTDETISPLSYWRNVCRTDYSEAGFSRGAYSPSPASARAAAFDHTRKTSPAPPRAVRHALAPLRRGFKFGIRLRRGDFVHGRDARATGRRRWAGVAGCVGRRPAWSDNFLQPAISKRPPRLGQRAERAPPSPTGDWMKACFRCLAAGGPMPWRSPRRGAAWLNQVTAHPRAGDGVKPGSVSVPDLLRRVPLRVTPSRGVARAAKGGRKPIVGMTPHRGFGRTAALVLRRQAPGLPRPCVKKTTAAPRRDRRSRFSRTAWRSASARAQPPPGSLSSVAPSGFTKASSGAVTKRTSVKRVLPLGFSATTPWSGCHSQVLQAVG